jgi:hypothetical protein
MNDVVLVALIGAFGTVAAGLPAVLIERARRENNGDHAIVRRKLRELGLQIEKVSTKIGSVDGKLERHLNSHKDGDLVNESDRRVKSGK